MPLLLDRHTEHFLPVSISFPQFEQYDIFSLLETTGRFETTKILICAQAINVHLILCLNHSYKDNPHIDNNNGKMHNHMYHNIRKDNITMTAAPTISIRFSTFIATITWILFTFRTTFAISIATCITAFAWITIAFSATPTIFSG